MPQQSPFIHAEPHEMAVVFAGHERPTAPWIIGRATDCDQQYVMHVATPVFVAKIAKDDEEGALSGLSYATSDDRSFYDLVWFDEVPNEAAIIEWIRQADQAVRRFERSATEDD